MSTTVTCTRGRLVERDSGAQQLFSQGPQGSRISQQLGMGGHRQLRLGPDRQHGPPAGQHRQIQGRVKAVAIDRLQGLDVAVELPQQGTVPFEVGESLEDLPRPGLGGEGSLLGAAQADEAPRAPVPPQALDPGAGDHLANRKDQQIKGRLARVGRIDVLGQFGGGLLNGGPAKAQGQVGKQQIGPAIADFVLQLLEHLGGIQKAVHQDQGRQGWRNLAAIFLNSRRMPFHPVAIGRW
jgi:hypothetical protein